ncbi:hypothetical protein [Sphingobacterium sp.]|uniref:hypothetical protein n=1 Tax=Sphingobacterium sp. TaxID=341027 RepID=UPI0031E20D7A
MKQLENNKANISYQLSTAFDLCYATVSEGLCTSQGSTALYLLSFAAWKNSEVYFDRSMEAITDLLSSIKKHQLILYWEGLPGLLRAINILVNENIIHTSIIKTLLPLEEEFVMNIAFFHAKNCKMDEIPYIGSLLLEIYNRRRLKNIVRTDVLLSLVQLINRLDDKQLVKNINKQALSLFLNQCIREKVCPALVARIRNWEVSDDKEIENLSTNRSLSIDNISSIHAMGIDGDLSEQETKNLKDLILLERLTGIHPGHQRYYLFI